MQLSAVLDAWLVVQDLTVADHRHGQLAVVQVRLAGDFGAHRVDNLAHRNAGGAVRAKRRLAAAVGDLAGRTLGHGVAFDLDELVDQASRRRAGACHHRGADAEAIDWVAAQTCDGELIQVGGDDDLGVERTCLVELLAHAA